MSGLINGASLPAMRLQASLVNTLQCVHVLGCSVVLRHGRDVHLTWVKS